MRFVVDLLEDGLLAVWWCGLCVVLTMVWFVVLRLRFAERFECAVRMTELLQASLMSCGSGLWVLRRGARAFRPSLEDLEHLGGLAFLRDCMFGYLFFDTAYELLLPFVRKRPLNKSFVLHHVVGIFAHVLARHHKAVSFFAALVYLAETSTVSLHVSWILNLTGNKSTKLFLYNGILGALCFLVFRVILPPITLYSILRSRHLFHGPSGWEQNYVFYLFLASHLFFMLLNLSWLPDLIALVRKNTSPADNDNHKKKQGLATNNKHHGDTNNTRGQTSTRRRRVVNPSS